MSDEPTTPTEPTGLGPSGEAIGAAWLADPVGRHQHRYWDGKRWTDHVSDQGEQSKDPYTSTAAWRNALPATNSRQRIVLLVAAAVSAIGLAVGLVPVRAAVIEDPRYNCGPPIFDRESQWGTDSFALAYAADAGSLNEPFSLDRTPDAVCPNETEGPRKLAWSMIWLGVIVAVVGWVFARDTEADSGGQETRVRLGVSVAALVAVVAGGVWLADPFAKTSSERRKACIQEYADLEDYLDGEISFDAYLRGCMSR